MTGLTRDGTFLEEKGKSVVTPALLIKDFTFTGQTK